MNEHTKLFLGWIALALGVFVYLHNLGSEHAATNPDEHLYWQITRMKAEHGSLCKISKKASATPNLPPFSGKASS